MALRRLVHDFCYDILGRYFGMKKRKIPENLDIVGNLLSNCGMTGENLVRDIFSYMDVSSIQGKFVRVFLKDTKILMKYPS